MKKREAKEEKYIKIEKVRLWEIKRNKMEKDIIKK